MTTDKAMVTDAQTRPIIGIENRTAQEAFDIMCDRIRPLLAHITAQAGEIELLRDENGQLVDDNSDLRNAPWPEWATAVLKVIRSHTEYDGYDDAVEGVDMPLELSEHLSEMEAANDRATDRAAEYYARGYGLRCAVMDFLNGAIDKDALRNRFRDWEACSGTRFSMSPAALTLERGEAEPVAVKPLEWRNLYPESTKWPKIWHGKGVMNALYTCEQYGPAYGWFGTDGSFATLEAAKAAAQADYERRILSTLSKRGEAEETPAPVQGYRNENWKTDNVELESALDAFWNVAYTQGHEQRGHDDEAGTAQKAEDELRRVIASLASPSPVHHVSVTYTQAECDEMCEIAERDGYEKAVQEIDQLTGGDGEYRVSMLVGGGVDDERHTPDAPAMIQRIVDRFEILNLLDDATKTGRDQPDDGPSPQSNLSVPCPCTLIEQDEDCPVGYPSLICGVCEGKGHATPEQVTALACEMVKIASDMGEPEDPFAAWESIDLIRSQHGQLRAALKPFAAAPYTGPNSFNRAALSDDDFRQARHVLAAMESQP